MEKLVEMDTFEIAFTHLDEFQVDILKASEDNFY